MGQSELTEYTAFIRYSSTTELEESWSWSCESDACEEEDYER